MWPARGQFTCYERESKTTPGVDAIFERIQKRWTGPEGGKAESSAELVVRASENSLDSQDDDAKYLDVEEDDDEQFVDVDVIEEADFLPDAEEDDALRGVLTIQCGIECRAALSTASCNTKVGVLLLVVSVCEPVQLPSPATHSFCQVHARGRALHITAASPTQVSRFARAVMSSGCTNHRPSLCRCGVKLPRSGV